MSEVQQYKVSEKKLINPDTGSVKTVRYSTAEAPYSLKPAYLGIKHNTYVKRHLDFKDKSIVIVEDGICDIDAEIQSELKNAGLQNILKLQEMRYGTLENAIARANDRGVYADVSHIPDSVGERASFIAKAKEEYEKMKAEFGLTDYDMKDLSPEKLAEAYAKKNTPQNNEPNGQGGAQ